MAQRRAYAFERLASRDGLNRFSGPASFRALARDQKEILTVIQTGMAQLADDVASIGTDIFLHYTADIDTASQLQRVRLRWRIKGVNKRFTFAELGSRIRKLPAPTKSFLEWAEHRASELNALESVFRSGATMTKTFMSVGSVRQYSS